MSDTIFTVQDTGQGVLKIIDGMRGLQVGVISPRGKVIGSIIVQGDKASFVVETSTGERLGCTHKLPTGSLITTFRA